MRAERRILRREMRVDRRRDDQDLVDHIVRGVRRASTRPDAEDRPPRASPKK